MSRFSSVLTEEPPALAEWLGEVLGVELAARALGVSDARTVKQWGDGTRAIRTNALLRLRTVAQIVDELSEELTPTGIQAWFTVFHPDFGFNTVIQILDEGPLEEAAPPILEVAFAHDLKERSGGSFRAS